MIAGKSVTRIDAWKKAAGTEKYLSDLDFPGALSTATIRSEIPHGLIKSIELDPSFDWSGICVLTADNFPGRNFVAMIKSDYPALAHDKINFRGEAVCLLAAEDPRLLHEARKHVTIVCDPLPAVLSIEGSVACQVMLREPDNVLSRCSIRRGAVEAGFAEADLIVEGRYTTGAVEHAYLEPNGVVAIPEDGGIRILGSIQCPFYVHNAVVKALELPGEKVVVRQVTTGGAFGGKEDFPSVLAVQAAAMALKTKRPVKIIYERNEDIVSSSKRHGSLVRHKTGVRKDGTLTAMQIDVLFDGGAYSTMSPVVLQRGVIHAAGPYRCPNVEIRGKAMATNHAPRGAFRGFGVPQTIFAVERHLDLIARRLGMSPLEIRKRNALVRGDTLPTGQVLKESVAAGLVLDRVCGLSDFQNKRSAFAAARLHDRGGKSRRGIGLSLFFHGAAFTGSGESRIKARAAIRLKDGGESVEVLASTVEMGQGYATVISQIAAEALGIDLACVSVATPDTSDVPDSGPTVASRSTMVVGSTIIKACESLLHELKQQVGRAAGCAPEEISCGGGVLRDGRGRLLVTFSSACGKYLESGGSAVIEAGYELPEGHAWDEENMRGDAYPCYAWAAEVVEVDVDMDTFNVTPLRATTVFDAGKAINPQTAVGQFEGGTLQSLGYGSLEAIKYEDGKILNDRFTTYIIPTSEDCPEYQTEIVQIPYSHGPFGAKGIGELSCDGAAAALASAIENATGINVAAIPATPEVLLEQWLETKGTT
ncbi:MAG: xanthine dehydrogenase family protein molybdopterin-binding subunit [Pseudomonadota bacterium]